MCFMGVLFCVGRVVHSPYSIMTTCTKNYIFIDGHFYFGFVVGIRNELCSSFQGGYSEHGGDD